MARTGKQNKKRILLAVLTALLIAALMAGATWELVEFTKRSVHRERTVYLAAQTQTSVALTDETLSQLSGYADVCARYVSSDLETDDDVYAFMDDTQDKIFWEGARLILVDKNANWYGEEGSGGRITSISNYERGTPDKLVYITVGVDADVESFVCRVRLDEPVTVSTGTGTAEICYCAVVCYMDTILSQLDMSFPIESNRFIIDENGLMLFKNFGLDVLLDGTNIFSKYRRVDFLFGDSGENQIERLLNGETVVGEFILNGENYYICSAPLSVNNWYAVYVLRADSLIAGSFIRTFTIYILAIGLIFVAAVISAVMLFVRILAGQKQLEQQQKANAYLEQAAKAKSDFLSNMSHDIRTPINGIMGMTTLASKENNPTNTQDCLRKIDASSRYLLSLVNDVLDMSSIENDKVVIVEKPNNIRKIVEDCTNIIIGQMQGRQLELKTDFDEIAHPYVLADALRLQSIFINILSNAVKYTPDGGTIWFQMRELPFGESGKCRIRFEIEDTGIGMKRDFLNRIWDAFAQEEGGSRTNYKGTGLGMSITKKYVDMMNGTIQVKSDYARGSVFTVEIPFTLDHTHETEEENPLSIEGCRILLAEDNELNRFIARELLESEGAAVTEVVDGRQALDTFKKAEPGSFDILLLDIMMPEMTGLEAAKAIRALKRPDARLVPIIAMTANTLEESIQASEAAGMNAYLTKPIDIPVVLKTLSSFYGRGDSRI